MKRHSFKIFLFLAIAFNTQQTIAQKSTEQQAIEILLAKKRSYNKNNKKGYRIQLYNGLETKARKLKSAFETEFPNTFTKLSYDSPEWKIQVGNYHNKLKADRALNEIRSKFGNAIVVPLK